MRFPFNTIIEPFKIKVVEPIEFMSRDEREHALHLANYNLFSLPSKAVLIDLLTDSGTSAMSAAQWGEIMMGDEAYAGSSSFYQFEEVARDLTGYKNIIPTHQGRAAERILSQVAIRKGSLVPANTHFDTTRANIEYAGGIPLDLQIERNLQPSLSLPFKGNIDLQQLEDVLKRNSKEIPFCIMTVTNNSLGGQPVSMENIKAASELLHSYNIPLILDACRFAENAYFIKRMEKGYENRSVKSIAQEFFRLGDGCIMSGKKDGLVNIGGFLALNNDQWTEEAKNLSILTEGFPTYGGLAGRDLAAFAQGLKEVVDENYLQYRIASIKYLGDRLTALNIPIVQPPGGHAIYIDARAFLDHLPLNSFPAQALALELYLEGGIRSVEVGSVMFGKLLSDGREEPSRMELVRLALPRRVYTQSHVDYIIEVLSNIRRHKSKVHGVKIISQAKFLRHFTAKFELI